MSVQTRTYDDAEHGDPHVVMVVSGTFDISRLVNLLGRGRCEDIRMRDFLVRQLHRHNAGRAAIRLLAAHGGPDLLSTVTPPSPIATDSLPGSIGEEWTRLQAASDDVPLRVRDEVARLIEDLRPFAEAADSSSFYVALDTLRALVGMRVKDGMDDDFAARDEAASGGGEDR